MNKLKEQLNISNFMYILTVLFAIGVLFKTLYERYQLPEGVCPVDNNRPLIYTAIALLIGVNLGISAYSYWKKRKG